jgi:hypothetical protein
LVSHGPNFVTGLSELWPIRRDCVSAFPKFFPASFGIFFVLLFERFDEPFRIFLTFFGSDVFMPI